MKLSTRNQIPATVVAVKHGEVMSVVKVELSSGDQITATITREAAEELELGTGTTVTVLVKSTEVMLGVE
jgi:molybdopterin-binding protein